MGMRRPRCTNIYREKKFQNNWETHAYGRAPRDVNFGILVQTTTSQTSMRKKPMRVLYRGLGAGLAQNAPAFYHIAAKMSIGNFAQKKHRKSGIFAKFSVNCHTITQFFFGLCSIKSILNTFPPTVT